MRTIKPSGEDYFDATGVYDSSLMKNQTEINNDVDSCFYLKASTGNVINFKSPPNLPLSSLTFAAPIVQSGTGTPTPENVRDFTIWEGFDIYQSQTQNVQDAIASHISFPSIAGEVCECECNPITGAITTTHKLLTFDGSENWRDSPAYEHWFFCNFVRSEEPDIYVNNNSSDFAFSNQYVQEMNKDVAKLGDNHFCVGLTSSGYLRFVIRDYDVASVEEFKAKLSEHPLQILCRLNAPVTYTIQPLNLRTLHGENYIWGKLQIAGSSATSDLTLSITHGGYLETLYNELEKKAFVSPSMFGAVGDGVADDTAAWQIAVDSGFDIKAEKGIYKVGQINVTKDISIDCGGSSFKCTSTTLFNCSGLKIGERQHDDYGDPNYTAYQSGYRLSNSNYSGFAMVNGTNQIDSSRDYYMAGCVCMFQNGTMIDNYPIDIENPSITLIVPVTVKISGIRGIDYLGSETKNFDWIKIKWGLNCIIEYINMHISKFSRIIWLQQCYHCTCRNLTITAAEDSTYTGSTQYTVMIDSSVFCSIYDSSIYNKDWSAVTTGGENLTYKTVVSHCNIRSKTHAGFGEHEASIGTIMRDCVISCGFFAFMSFIDNVVVTSAYTSNKKCFIRLGAPSNKNIAGARLSNIAFSPESGSSFCGIELNTYPYVANLTVHYDNISISNIENRNKDVLTCRVFCGFKEEEGNPNHTHFKFGEIVFNNCGIPVDSFVADEYTDITNLTIKTATYST